MPVHDVGLRVLLRGLPRLAPDREVECISRGMLVSSECRQCLLKASKGTWVWLADHDLDDSAQTRLSLYSGRGILSESAGPVWLIGTGVYSSSLVNWSDADALSFLSL